MAVLCELLVDKLSLICYNKNNNISPHYLQEIVSVMCWRQTGALLEGHSSYGVSFVLPQSTNQPKWPARSGPVACLVENNGQIPALLAAGGTGRVGHQDLPILYAPEHDKVSSSSEVPWGHDGHQQLAAAERII